MTEKLNDSAKLLNSGYGESFLSESPRSSRWMQKDNQYGKTLAFGVTSNFQSEGRIKAFAFGILSWYPRYGLGRSQIFTRKFKRQFQL